MYAGMVSPVRLRGGEREKKRGEGEGEEREGSGKGDGKNLLIALFLGPRQLPIACSTGNEDS